MWGMWGNQSEALESVEELRPHARGASGDHSERRWGQHGHGVHPAPLELVLSPCPADLAAVTFALFVPSSVSTVMVFTVTE